MSARVLRRPSAIAALVILAVAVFMCAFGSLLAPYGALHQDVNAINQGPSAHHLFGTDYLGRDVLSRLMAGTRLSVLAALEAVGIAVVLGTIPGIAAGVIGGWLDWWLSRIVDALMTLPAIILAVAVTAAIGNGLTQAMVPIGVLMAPLFFRVIRAATLEFAHTQYVEAATLLGAGRWRVIRAHVLRKVLPTLAVTAASAAAYALLTVSFLTFLGIGVEPPTPTWGGVLSSDLEYLAQAPWAPFIPGAVIALTVGALNALADAVRDHVPAHQLPAIVDPVLPVTEPTHGDLSAA
ncbi:MAG TPA: ABC transporter permease [Solirubrobacteraceae bacterium]|jgi:peptide/nickel transport system permease protein